MVDVQEDAIVLGAQNGASKPQDGAATSVVSAGKPPHSAGVYLCLRNDDALLDTDSLAEVMVCMT